VHDDKVLFEFLVLESFQAGLSWLTILRKRENFRRSFSGFDVKKIARYDETKIAELMTDEGIIRNRLKIEATINNAQKFMEVQKEFGSFDKYIWSFTGGIPVTNHPSTLKDIPASTTLSITVQKNLAKRGFKFLGGTIMYAYMQAVGIVNDHVADCWIRV
jgi:DNA-3-methyladenine glycosylase I